MSPYRSRPPRQFFHIHARRFASAEEVAGNRTMPPPPPAILPARPPRPYLTPAAWRCHTAAPGAFPVDRYRRATPPPHRPVPPVCHTRARVAVLPPAGSTGRQPASCVKGSRNNARRQRRWSQRHMTHVLKILKARGTDYTAAARKQNGKITPAPPHVMLPIYDHRHHPPAPSAHSSHAIFRPPRVP